MRTFLGTLFGAVHSPVEPVKTYVTERGAVIVGLYLLFVAVGRLRSSGRW